MKKTLVVLVASLFALSAFAAETNAPAQNAGADQAQTQVVKKAKKKKKKSGKKSKKSKKSASSENAAPAEPAAPAAPATGQ